MCFKYVDKFCINTYMRRYTRKCRNERRPTENIAELYGLGTNIAAFIVKDTLIRLIQIVHPVRQQ